MTTTSSDGSGATPLRLQLPAKLKSERLDRALSGLLPELSRAHIKELISAGHVLVDGAPVTKPSTLIERDVEVELTVAPRLHRRVEVGDPDSLVVLYEDEALVVIDKPPGVLAHPTDTASGASISELATARYGELPALQGKDRPGVVHRLDAGTSGVMVLARTADAFRALMQQFRDRTVEKTYLALVYGDPRFDSGWIEGGIARDERDPSRMSIAPAGEGRDARTYYEVVERFRGLALVRAQPKSGRTHQIRVHLTSIGLPLIGDKLYRRKGGHSIRLADDAPTPARQCLHAASLRFVHPSSGEVRTFEAPPAPDFARMLEWIRANHGLGRATST